MKNRVKDFKKMVRKCVFGIFGIQIFSLLTYYLLYGFTLIFYHFKNYNTAEAQAAAEACLWLQILISVVTEFSICILAYKKVWKIGDFHAGEVLTGGTVLRKKLGLKIGFFSIAPILICGILSSVLKFFNFESTVVKYVLGLFVARWSGVVNYFAMFVNDSSFIALILYLVICIPLIITCNRSYKNGFCGLKEDLMPKKRYSTVNGNEKAILVWNA